MARQAFWCQKSLRPIKCTLNPPKKVYRDQQILAPACDCSWVPCRKITLPEARFNKRQLIDGGIFNRPVEQHHHASTRKTPWDLHAREGGSTMSKAGGPVALSNPHAFSLAPHGLPAAKQDLLKICGWAPFGWLIVLASPWFLRDHPLFRALCDSFMARKCETPCMNPHWWAPYFISFN